MKKKILSFILAFAMIFSAFLPVVEILPAVDSAALISAQNANIAPVKVGTLGELVFAMENSVAGQTITLTNDIKSSNAFDWQMDISADGILVLDLNGYDIELNSKNTAVLFNITKSTNFHIIDTKAKAWNLGAITFSSKVKDKEISVIAVDNKDAHLNLHNLVTIFLKPYPEDTTLPEKSSILRFGAFKQFNNYGTNLNSTIDNTLGVSFQPARNYNYKESGSDFGWYKGNISTEGACFDFDLVNESAQKDFIRFANITMIPGSDDLFKDYALKCYHEDSSPVKQFFMMQESLMTVKVGGTVVSNNKALKTISSKTKVEYVSSCTHGSYNDILSYTAGHIKVCSYCGNSYTFEPHSIGTPSAHKEPDANNAGKTSGVKCNTANCTYDLGVYLPKVSEPVVDGTTIYVEDYDELQSAFLKARANDIIKLSNDISFNDTYSANTAVLRPQARGRLVLDLNGYDIIANSTSTKYLFDLSMFDPLRGAVSLYIVNSSSDKEAKISFEEAYYDGCAVVNLDNNAACLFIADDVKLAISSSQDIKDTSVIYARRFRELRIYRGQLQNALSTGVGIMFRPGSAVEYNNAKFSIDGSKITAPDACLDATIYAYKEFKIGSVDLIANSGKRAIKAIDTETAKLSNIIRSGYQAAGVNNSTLLKDISKNAIYFRPSDYSCSHADNATVLIYDLSHRVYCKNCYWYNDKGEHNLVPESIIAAGCSDPGQINYTCVCGHKEKESIDPTGNHSGTVINAKPATCSQPGVKEAYFKCEMCKKYFLESTKAEIELERVIIPPHGSTLITDKGGRNRLTLKKDATCTLDGIKESYYTCKKCDAWISTKGLELDKTANVIPKLSHNLTAVGANPATCTTDGNIAHYKCTRENCGMLFSDAAGTNAITDVTAKATGHSYEWVVTKPAEVGVDGEQEYTCKVCKDVKEKKPITALEPDYILGDVDMDGNVSSADARLALRASVGLETLSEIKKKAANVDKDSTITSADARLILRASVGLETLK